MRSAPCWVGALQGQGILLCMVGVLRCIQLPQAIFAAVCWAMSWGSLIFGVSSRAHALMLMSSVRKLAKDVITSTEGQGHACMRTYDCRCMSVGLPDMVLVVVVQAACTQPTCHKCPCGQVWDMDALVPHLHKTSLRARE